MKRIKEEFLNRLGGVISLNNLDILEIGSGDGTRTAQIAERCNKVVGIEPDEKLIQIAEQRNIPNASFQAGAGEKIDFKDNSYDMVIFTLSLHHIPVSKMTVAISEAIRVVKPDGYIVFLEPTETGSFFEAELHFEASDGDERAEKKAAHAAIKSHSGLHSVKEIIDETVFRFDSTNDFVNTLSPKKNLDELDEFLKKHNYILNAQRRLNIFKPTKNIQSKKS